METARENTGRGLWIMRSLCWAVVFVCMIEAFYWPLLIKGPHLLQWWQAFWPALAGYIMGAPVFLALLMLDVNFNRWDGFFSWLLSAEWALFAMLSFEWAGRKIRDFRRRL